MNTDNKKVSLDLSFQEISKEDKNRIENLNQMPMIWNIFDIRDRLKQFRREKNEVFNQKLKKMREDPHLQKEVAKIEKELRETYWNRKDTLDDIECFFNLAGFTQIIKTKSLRYSDIKHGNILKNDKPDVFITAAHPCGVLMIADTYFANSFGQKLFNSIYVITQTDVGFGVLSDLSTINISTQVSSQDMSACGSKVISSTFIALKGILEVIDYLDQIQRSGKILEFKNWDTSKILNSISPHEIIDINFSTYPELKSLNKKNVIKKIAKDIYASVENTFSNKNKNHDDLSQRVRKIQGLDNVLQSAFFSSFTANTDEDEVNLHHEMYEEGKIRYPKEIEFFENKRRSSNKTNSNNPLPYFYKNNFNWKPLQISLLEIQDFATHSNIRYFSDRDKKIISSWIDLIDTTTCDSDKKYKDYSKVNLDKATFDNANLDKKIEGGLSFPSILLAQAFKTENAFNLLIQTLALAPKELVEEWCSVCDDSGFTFPMRILNHSIKGKDAYLYGDKKGLAINENLEYLIDFVIKKAGSKNITLSSSKFSPNGLWIMNVDDSLKKEYNIKDFSYYEGILSLFKSHRVYIDNSWRVYHPNKIDIDNFTFPKSIKQVPIVGSHQINGDKLEDIIDNFKSINTNPEYSRAILNQILSDTTMSKKGAPKRKI